MRKIYTLIVIALLVMTGCSGRLPPVEEIAAPQSTSSCETTTVPFAEETTETTIDDAAYKEDEKQKYLAAKKLAEKDNSGVDVTYCAAVESFIKDGTAPPASEAVYDYGGMTFSDIRYNDMYPHTLSFVSEVDGGVFCGLNVGMPYSQIKAVLGEPNGMTSNSCIYYFDGYSVTFYATGKIECIGILKMPQLDKNYDKIFTDTLRWKDDGSSNSWDIFTKLRDIYPDYYFFSGEWGGYIDYPNGFGFGEDGYIDISPSYYGCFDYVETDLGVYWNTCDMWLSEFGNFCEKFFSDEWAFSPDNRYSVYFENNCRYYRGCAYIKDNSDNSIKKVSFGGYPSEICWLSDCFFICNTHVYGPFVVDVKSGQGYRIDMENKYYSEMRYSLDDSGNIILTDENDNKTVYTKEEIILFLGK